MIIITGPTATGKKECALELARLLDGEIFNDDVGQFYVPFSIGTAKPNWHSETIPHHLFDIIDNPKDFDVLKFYETVKELVKNIRQKGKTPIVVGGSVFYIKSLFFPPKAPGIDTGDLGDKGSWDDLYAIDPERAASVNPTDTYRIKRALAIWQKTGIKPSIFAPTLDTSWGNVHIIAINREISDLNTRIELRTHAMIQQGWIDETRRLLDTVWEEFIARKKLIGYNEIIAYLKKQSCNGNDLVEEIALRTRQYAKRQRTFLRMIARCLSGNPTITVHEWNLTSQEPSIYIKQLSNTLMH